MLSVNAAEGRRVRSSLNSIGAGRADAAEDQGLVGLRAMFFSA
jgi:hypothetical protein